MFLFFHVLFPLLFIILFKLMFLLLLIGRTLIILFTGILFYEEAGDIAMANKIYNKATQTRFKKADLL